MGLSGLSGLSGESGLVSRGSSLLNNLLAWWGLHDAANGNRIDSSGNGFTLTDVTGNVGQAAGLVGNAASFTGVSTQLLRNNNQIVPSGPFTISTWVNFTSITGVHIWTQLPSAANTKQALRFVGSVLGIEVNGSSSDVAASSPATGTWLNVVATYDGSSNTALYVNNSSVATGSGRTFAAGGTLTCVGNNDNPNNPLNASLQLMGLWNTVLTAGQIASLYNGGLGLDYPFKGAP